MCKELTVERQRPRAKPPGAQAILGTRIRSRRRALGLTQAALARSMGISASYLNLIEGNKRSIAGPRLRKAAKALGVSLDELDGAAERRLLATLEDMAHVPDIEALGVEADAVGEFIGRFPGWARAVVALARAEQDASAAARALADRLTHDPFLGETVHRMLTQVAAVRSAAEILVEYPDISDERRTSFQSMIARQVHELSHVGETLAGYFDKVDESDRTLTPLDEVEALFEAHDNHFAALEQAAAPFASELGDVQFALRRERARALATAKLGGAVDRLLAGETGLETTAARERAREALLRYAGRVMLAPMERFAPRAQALGFDVEALADEFSLNLSTACQRLTALPPGDGRPRFGYLRANAAGSIVVARPLAGLTFPRHSAACPLWVLFRAQQSPEAVLRQRAVFPSGSRFVFLARARNTGPTGFGKPRHYLIDMLAMTEEDARMTIYAPEDSVPVEEVGPSCRTCPRRTCAHRVEDPLAGEGATG